MMTSFNHITPPGWLDDSRDVPITICPIQRSILLMIASYYCNSELDLQAHISWNSVQKLLK